MKEIRPSEDPHLLRRIGTSRGVIRTTPIKVLGNWKAEEKDKKAKSDKIPIGIKPRTNATTDGILTTTTRIVNKLTAQCIHREI